MAGVAFGSCLEGQDVVARAAGGVSKSWQAQHFGDAVAKSWQAQHFGDAVAEVVAGAAFCASGCSVIASIQGAHGTCVWTFGKNIACGVIRSFNCRDQFPEIFSAKKKIRLGPKNEDPSRPEKEYPSRPKRKKSVIKAFDVAEVKLYDWKLAVLLWATILSALLVRILNTNYKKGVSRWAQEVFWVLVAWVLVLLSLWFLAVAPIM